VTQPERDAAMQRSQEQVANELAMGEVSDVMLNLEHTLARARAARKKVVKLGTERNVELALSDLITELDQVRKRLTRNAYYPQDTVRLL
jgi:hypothetical protein